MRRPGLLAAAHSPVLLPHKRLICYIFSDAVNGRTKTFSLSYFCSIMFVGEPDPLQRGARELGGSLPGFLTSQPCSWARPGLGAARGPLPHLQGRHRSQKQVGSSGGRQSFQEAEVRTVGSDLRPSRSTARTCDGLACRQQVGHGYDPQGPLLKLQCEPRGHVAGAWTECAWKRSPAAEKGCPQPRILRLWSTFGLLLSSGSTSVFPACAPHLGSSLLRRAIYWFGTLGLPDSGAGRLLLGVLPTVGSPASSSCLRFSVGLRVAGPRLVLRMGGSHSRHGPHPPLVPMTVSTRPFGTWLKWPNYLGSSTAYWLCDLRQVTWQLCASFAASVKCDKNGNYFTGLLGA